MGPCCDGLKIYAHLLLILLVIFIKGMAVDLRQVAAFSFILLFLFFGLLVWPTFALIGLSSLNIFP